MPITQQGQLNLTALSVPNVDVVIVPPATVQLNGVPTNIWGLVGVSSWGPVDQPAIVSDYASFQQSFGPLIARTNDLGTAVYVGVQQGASNYRIVRVTDGTDVAATVTVLSTCLTVTSIYTGSYGNQATFQTAPGSKIGTTKGIVSMPGVVSEIFDNISGSGNALWLAMANAINQGISGVRGPSQMVTATAGAGATAPVAATYALTGGTDGVSGVTSTSLVGVDGSPRTGMYALRNQGCGLVVLVDLTDSTQWTTMESFALSEGAYVITSGPVGDSITNAISTKASSGADCYDLKVMFGDWIYWNDPVNSVTRLISPSKYPAALLANLSPEQSSLNKQLYGIVSTQRSGLGAINGIYSQAELTQLFNAGIDVICNPAPGGNYFAVRGGINSSSNNAINGDNYPRMTNYLAATLEQGMGLYIGQTMVPTIYNNVAATLNTFLKNMLNSNMISAFSVVCNATNNPPESVALGNLVATVQVQYLSIVKNLIVNLQGGQTVTISEVASPQNS